MSVPVCSDAQGLRAAPQSSAIKSVAKPSRPAPFLFSQLRIFRFVCDMFESANSKEFRGHLAALVQARPLLAVIAVDRTPRFEDAQWTPEQLRLPHTQPLPLRLAASLFADKSPAASTAAHAVFGSSNQQLLRCSNSFANLLVGEQQPALLQGRSIVSLVIQADTALVLTALRDVLQAQRQGKAASWISPLQTDVRVLGAARCGIKRVKMQLSVRADESDTFHVAVVECSKFYSPQI